ncbi:MAG TPA: hypothetical protein VGD26_10425 [Chitinophagaceae bacterium]
MKKKKYDDFEDDNLADEAFHTIAKKFERKERPVANAESFDDDDDYYERLEDRKRQRVENARKSALIKLADR